MRGVRFSPYEKRRALKRWLDEKEDIFKVAKQTKCSERTLWRWKSQYDGTLESLNNASSKPHTPHPNAHTQEEAAHIKELFEDNPNISYAEALGVLRTKYAYSRTYFGFYRFVKKKRIAPFKTDREVCGATVHHAGDDRGKNANGREICSARM